MTLEALLVEDSKTQAAQIKEILESVGLSVRVAYDGPEGLQAATGASPGARGIGREAAHDGRVSGLPTAQAEPNYAECAGDYAHGEDRAEVDDVRAAGGGGRLHPQRRVCLGASGNDAPRAWYFERLTSAPDRLPLRLMSLPYNYLEMP